MAAERGWGICSPVPPCFRAGTQGVSPSRTIPTRQPLRQALALTWLQEHSFLHIGPASVLKSSNVSSLAGLLALPTFYD